MKYEEAKKAVANRKPRENYMVIKFDSMSSCEEIILPHKAGIALMEALSQAELYTHSWGEKPVIKPLETDYVRAATYSHIEYDRLRMAILLGVSPDDLKHAEATGRTDQYGP
jgi:hypothetical protein